MELKTNLPIRVLIIPLAASLILTACGGVELPSTSPAAISSIVVATQKALASAATSTSQTATPSLTPSPVPPTPTRTATPAFFTPEAISTEADRIVFRSGSGMATVSGNIGVGQKRSFVFSGTLAQVLLVRLDSPDHDLALSMSTGGGTAIVKSAEGKTAWRGSLPRTEDYYVAVHGGKTEEEFTLTLQTATRIKFKEGTQAVTVDGSITSGLPVAYSILGVEGNLMQITLSRVGEDAVLRVSGYVDGQTYLSSQTARTSFKLNVVNTQDYIIEVVPLSNKDITYVLDVKIP